MTELQKIQAAFEEWSQSNCNLLGNSEEERLAMMTAQDDAAALFWPLLESFYARQADPKRGVWADEMAAVRKLKAQLGMELMAHEK